MIDNSKLKILEGVISKYCGSPAIVSERQVASNPMLLKGEKSETVSMLTVRTSGNILNVYVPTDDNLVITLGDLNKAKLGNSLDVIKAISDILRRDLIVVSSDGSKKYYETSPCDLEDYDKYYENPAS